MASLEDVYWLEDSKARQVLQKDFQQWSAARQALPISKQRLEALKGDLWSEVVKSSNHQDAWTWGKISCFSLNFLLDAMRRKPHFKSARTLTNKTNYFWQSVVKIKCYLLFVKY